MDNSPASVRFQVSVDGKDVFATDVIRARAAPQAIDVPLSGAKSFDLTVDVGGDDRNSDQADWADAKVVLQDGSELWLDDIARRATPVGGLPFSFVCGGKSEANTNPRDWCVLQYHLPDEREGIVMAFRRDQSPYGSYSCGLREIDPPATYQVKMYHGYDPETPITMNGSDLEKLNITIGERPGSVIAEYKQLK